MAKKQKLELEEKIRIVRACICKEISISEAARKAGVGFHTVESWIRIYENEGAGGFTYQANKEYSSELKTAAVLDYLRGKGSHQEICKKYGIRGRRTLEVWIKVYNAHGDFNSVKHSGGGSYMKQGRVENNRHAAEMEYSGNHEMGHMLNYLLVKEMNRKKGSTDRLFANKEDFDFQVTANKLVDKALKANMSEDEYNSLIRYGKDVPKKKGDTTAHKAGQINFSANKLGGDKDSRGYTSKYGATDAGEFFAEAFADVYRNGSEARSTSITLVKLYEKNMKYFNLNYSWQCKIAPEPTEIASRAEESKKRRKNRRNYL